MRRFFGASAAALSLAIAASIVTAAPARAADPGQWDPGYIISDANFFDGSAMTADDVQNFLNSKVSSCTSSSAACLRDYRADSSSKASDRFCGPYQGASQETAAVIISKVAVACNISPKVILVTLQKEQGLITARGPSATAYVKAMGYFCPDTLVNGTIQCDPAYAGFFNQVYNAARQFQRYKYFANTADHFTYVIGSNQILYKQGCDSTTVAIRNQATANLYNYTPYQPNSSALSNLYGSGDGCASYGNRNFWRDYTDWFGDPRGGDPAFVKAIFTDIMGYTPSDQQTRDWNYLLMTGRAKVDLANELLYSTDNRRAQINAAYRSILGRDAEPAGMYYWLSVTTRGNLPIDEVQHTFLESDEYYAQLGNEPLAFVQDVYKRLLGRTASSDEADYWVKVIQHGDRRVVVWSIYNSTESSWRRVDAMYRALLGRPAEQSAMTYWGPLVIRNSDNVIRSFLIGSAEYSTRAAARFPGLS